MINDATSHVSDSDKLEELATYDPDQLLDTLMRMRRFKYDAELARALEVEPAVISKIRHRRLPVGASLLIRMHEISDLSIGELRALMGDCRKKIHISTVNFKPKRGKQLRRIMTMCAPANNVTDDFGTYDPSRLLNELIEKLCVQHDSGLAKAIGVAQTVISRIRHRRMPLGPVMLIRMHEISELTIGELRLLMGDRRKKMRHNGKAF